MSNRAGNDRAGACCRRGFASLLAIGSIALLAVAVASMASLFSQEFQRTRSAAADAQARQLLLAGAADVTERAARWGPAVAEERWEVSLPTALAGRGAAMVIHVRSADGPLGIGDPKAGEVVAELEAKGAEGRPARQVLRFAHEGDRWRLEAVALR